MQLQIQYQKIAHGLNMAWISYFEQDLTQTQFHAKKFPRALLRETCVLALSFYARNLIIFACLPQMFTLMLTPWSLGLTLASRFPKVVCFSSSPFLLPLLSYMQLLLFFPCKLLAHGFGTHGHLLLALLSLV